jgi:recombinational DNA repair protein RecR
MKKDEEYWAGLAHLSLAANLQLRVFWGRCHNCVKLRKKSPCNSCTSRERTKADLALVIQQQEHKKTSSF